jgi:hypothetical protein
MKGLKKIKKKKIEQRGGKCKKLPHSFGVSPSIGSELVGWLVCLGLGRTTPTSDPNFGSLKKVGEWVLCVCVKLRWCGSMPSTGYLEVVYNERRIMRVYVDVRRITLFT